MSDFSTAIVLPLDDYELDDRPYGLSFAHEKANGSNEGCEFKCPHCGNGYDDPNDVRACYETHYSTFNLSAFKVGDVVLVRCLDGEYIVGEITGIDGINDPPNEVLELNGKFVVRHFLEVRIATPKLIAIVQGQKREIEIQSRLPNLRVVDSHQVEIINNADLHAKSVEELAVRMRSPENVETFAIKYSVLNDEEEVELMEFVHWKYYLMWLPMHLVAIYMMLKVFAYRFCWVPLLKRYGKVSVTAERMLLGPVKGVVLFDALDSVANLLRNGVTTSVALDIAYNLRKIRPTPKSFGELACDFWINQPDGHGLRNRLKVIYQKLVSEIISRVNDGEVKLLALASGSAQADIEAISRVRTIHPDMNISATLVDLNETSLNMAARLAEDRGVKKFLDIRLENIKTFLADQPENTWDVVEMVGFLDYRNNDSVIKICREIRRVLKPGGVFITSSICPTLWSFPVRWVVNWPLLIRRSKLKFKYLLRSAWTESDIYYLRYVPTKSHVVAFLTKQN